MVVFTVQPSYKPTPDYYDTPDYNDTHCIATQWSCICVFIMFYIANKCCLRTHVLYILRVTCIKQCFVQRFGMPSYWEQSTVQRNVWTRGGLLNTGFWVCGFSYSLDRYLTHTKPSHVQQWRLSDIRSTCLSVISSCPH